jgi:hypothetical protein
MAAEVLENYYSDSENEAGEFQRVRKKQKSHNYKLAEAFKCFEDAKKFVKAAGVWTYDTSRDLEAGRKVYYNCKDSRSCPSKLYLFHHGDLSSVIVHMFHAHVPHSRNNLFANMYWV